MPSWRFLAAGVEQRRSRTLVRTAVRAPRWSAPWPGRTPAADRALQSFPGVGAWTSAEVRQRAHGDPDAWSIGDYHVGKDITYALTGEALDDDACTEILEPYRGHRFRVQSLLGHGRPAPPAPGAADDPADPHPVRDRRTLLRRTQRCQRLVSSAPVGADPGSGSSSGRARNAARSNTR